MTIPKSLLGFAEQRYQLIHLPYDNCPVHLAMAMPVGGDGGGDVRAAGYLPPAARMGTGRTPSGRGLSQEQAAISTLGEAAQLVSASVWGDETITRSRSDHLTGHVISSNEFLKISDDQYASRDDWNSVHGDHDWIPNAIDPEMQIDWVRVPSLSGGEPAWIPAACMYIGWQNNGNETAFCIADTNGTAAGETIEAATVSAFLELVERDATAIWWHGQFQRSAVDLSNLAIPQEFLEWLSTRKRMYQVLNLTHDLGIPVFAAISSEPDGRFIGLGIAADFDPSKAALSALTEMCQMEFNLSMAKSNPDMVVGTPLGNWSREVSLLSVPHLQPSTNGTGVQMPEPSIMAGNCDAPLMQVKNLCKQHNLDAYVVDLTRPEVGVPAVRVLVPSLCHYKRRDAALRLSEVPQKLGWSRPASAGNEKATIPLMI